MKYIVKILNSGEVGMSKRGVIIGCDQKQEWLLPWWWKHYSSYNDLPVSFVDFGMSEKALSWCKKRGTAKTLPPSSLGKEKRVSSSHKKQWEDHYGKGVFYPRSAWFKKPQALILSPFEQGLWLDLDCQVNGSLEPIFNSLIFGAEIALVKEPECMQYQEVALYNSGVIAFQKNADILHHWMKEASLHSEKHVGDQSALSEVIFQKKPSLVELPFHCNWLRILGEANYTPLINHWTGVIGKARILQEVHANFREYESDLGLTIKSPIAFEK
jgi:hypothetical protein